MSYVYTGKLPLGLHCLCAGRVDDSAICLVGDAAFELIKPTMDHGVSRVLIPIGFSFAVLYALNLCVLQLLKTRAEKKGVDLASDNDSEEEEEGFVAS